MRENISHAGVAVSPWRMRMHAAMQAGLHALIPAARPLAHGTAGADGAN